MSDPELVGCLVDTVRIIVSVGKDSLSYLNLMNRVLLTETSTQKAAMFAFDIDQQIIRVTISDAGTLTILDPWSLPSGPPFMISGFGERSMPFSEAVLIVWRTYLASGSGGA
jgi:hypothetical protein